MTTSANYKLLTTPEELENSKILREAWKCPQIPQRQWDAFANERELAKVGRYNEVPPFRAFLASCDYIDGRELGEFQNLLDVGASTGYYGDLLKLGGFSNWSYTALDYSPAFKEFAAKHLPHIRFDVGDILDLPYANRTFDIVVMESSAIHKDDFDKALTEVTRVSAHYVIMNRMFTAKETQQYQKTAYDIPVLELWLGNSDLDVIFHAKRLYVIRAEEITKGDGFSQWTLVMEKR